MTERSTGLNQGKRSPGGICRGGASRGYAKTLSVAAMMLLIATLLAGITAPAGAATNDDATLAPLLASDGDTVAGSYIVVMNPDADTADAAEASDALERTVEAASGEVTQQYRTLLVGFAATMDAATVERLRASPFVSYIEQDSVVTKSGDQANPVWGLDRIDQSDRPLDNNYHYDTDGSGVTVYVIDTGIRSTHNQLAGRVAGGRSFISGGPEDCDGHGTHVAGTVAATTYGVAKQADVYGIRVLNCNGSGTTSGVIAGMNWVAANYSSPAVANMSLGGGASTTLDNAITAMFNAGILPVVAAGNDDANACNASPARAARAVTVASSTSADVRSWFSNWGSCVDLFAPGSSIRSLGIGNDNATVVYSGTSMASPHVAGVAALYLDANPNATPAQVTDAILGGTSNGKISDLAGSPNKLLYSLLTDTPPPVEDPVVSVVSQTVTETERSQVVRVTFQLDQPAAVSTRVRFATVAGTATQNVDYSRRLGTIVFAPGVTERTTNIVVRGDRNVEPTEQFTVELNTPLGLTLGDNATITIEDNDVPGPVVNVESQTVTETNRSQVIQVTFRLEEPATAATRVRYSTVPGTATRNNDYTRRAGTVVFARGRTERTINVTIRGGAIAEPTEQFTIEMNTPLGLTLGANATVTILDDDGE
ncbi:MAG: S8 family serine peptidase [Acidimicrobiales bacterium]